MCSVLLCLLSNSKCSLSAKAQGANSDKKHCCTTNIQKNKSTEHLPNHLMLGSTLATVPGATVDWNCNGLMTFPRLLLEVKDQSQCDILLKICIAGAHRNTLSSLTISASVCTYSAA